MSLFQNCFVKLIQRRCPAFLIFHNQRSAHSQRQRHTPIHREMWGWFEMIGPPRQRTSGHITFVSLCCFLALIFENVCLVFQPRSRPPETVQDCVSGVSQGVCRIRRCQRAKGSGRKCNGVGKRTPAKEPRSCKNTPRRTLSHGETSGRLGAGGSRWLHTLTSIYQNPVYSGWQDWAAEESTCRERWMWYPPHLWEKARQLWPEAIPKDLEGDWCCTKVSMWLLEKKKV